MPYYYIQSRTLIGSSTTRLSAHIPWVEKVKMEERFAQPTEDEIKSLIENRTPKNTKKATKFGMKVFDGKKDISCISNDYLDRFLPKLYCLCCYLPVCLQPSRRLIINSFCFFFSQNPVDVDIIKQLFHSILSYMANSQLGAARLVGYELMYDSISWNNS